MVQMAVPEFPTTTQLLFALAPVDDKDEVAEVRLRVFSHFFGGFKCVKGAPPDRVKTRPVGT